jgi:fatty-acyl-CoA synthase
MEAQGIGFWLKKRAVLSGDKEALVEGSRRLSYRELNTRVNRLAQYLQSQRLKKGDRLALLAYNGTEYVEVIFAAAKLGLILIPLNWRLSPAELAFNLSDSGTGFLIFDPEFLETVKAFKDQTPIREMMVLGHQELWGARSYEQGLAAQTENEPIPEEPVGLDTPHIIMYTAGTTGRPKGAVLTQGASFWNAVNLNLDMHFTPEDRDLLVLPMFHIGGIGLFTLPTLYAGGTVILQRTFDPARTLHLIKEEKATLLFGVPAIFLFLIQHPNFHPSFFKTLRLVMSGGAPLPVSLVKEYMEAGIVLQQGFGMSEAAPSISTLSKERAIQKAGSIGSALFHVEAKVVNDDLGDLPSGEVGELVIRGPNLMQEYWNRPEATIEAFAGGWFHTGDLARMDPEGDITIIERKKDMFISGGENVYPAEVENAIYELPQVSEAAVIGTRDEKWGEVGRAIVVLKKEEHLSEEDVLNHLKSRLAKFKIPRRVVFQELLPRNAAGKVLKTVLREKFN